jgi:hypothetical protein
MTQPRPVPQHIDRSLRGLEYLLAFMVPMFLIRPFAEGLGILLAIVLPLLYMKFTIGKPDGYLLHRLYRLGVPLPGLLHPKIKCFER